jgi:hypothetical protein
VIAEEAACPPDEQAGVGARMAKRLFLRDVVLPLGLALGLPHRSA